MSLFEENDYEYRDTFFLYLKDDQRPTVEQITNLFQQLGPKYEISNLKERDGYFGSVSVKSPQDSSAIDITFVTGEEVLEQIHNMMLDFRTMTLVGDDREKLEKFQQCNSRFDLFHFEFQGNAGGGAENQDFMDPGGLLLVMERLAALTGGVGIDPQSQTFL